MLRMIVAASLLTGCVSAGAVASAERIEGAEWRAVEIGGAPVVPGSAVTLRLRDGRAGGEGGCNLYGGPYTLGEGGRLRFGPMATTRRACTDEARNRQERLFHDILGDVTRCRIDADGNLILSAEGSRTIRFRR